jgi:hypothetical protein
MTDSPPAALLLWRDSDTVRLCGLPAASTARNLVRERCVSRCRREAERLLADVCAGEGQPAEPWVQLPGTGQPVSVQWGCTCAVGQAHLTHEYARPLMPVLACVHVAAVLTAWVRYPEEFVTPNLDDSRSQHDAPYILERPAVSHSLPGRVATTTDPHRPPIGSLAAPDALDQLLWRLSDDALAETAHAILGEDSEPVTVRDRKALVRRLHDTLVEPPHLERMLRELDPATAWLMTAIWLLGGAVTYAEIEGIASRSNMDEAAMMLAIDALAKRCLLVPVYAQSAGLAPASLYASRAPTGWHIPRDVRERLGGGISATLVDAIHALGQQSPRRSPRSRTSKPRTEAGAVPLRQLCAAIVLILSAPNVLETAQRRPNRSVASSAEDDGKAVPLPAPMGEPERREVEWWARGAHVPPRIARLALQVVQRVGEHGTAGHPLLALHRLPMSEWPVALRAGFQAWLNAETLAELTDLASYSPPLRVLCRSHTSSRHVAEIARETTDARRFVASVVAALATDMWLALDDLIEGIWRINPHFLRGRQQSLETPWWWLEDHESGDTLRAGVHGNWLRGDAQFAASLIIGPLHWWGAIDVARDASGTVHALRLTDFGAYLLGATRAAPPLPRGIVSGWGAAVRPAGHAALAVQPLAADAAMIEALLAWGRVAKVSGGRITVELSRDVFCQNRDIGREPATLLLHLARLDARDHTYSTHHVEALFSEWSARYGRTRIIRHIGILRGRDEVALREALTAIPEIAATCEFVPPNVALVPLDSIPRMRQALGKRGFAT